MWGVLAMCSCNHSFSSLMDCTLFLKLLLSKQYKSNKYRSSYMPGECCTTELYSCSSNPLLPMCPLDNSIQTCLDWQGTFFSKSMGVSLLQYRYMLLEGRAWLLSHTLELSKDHSVKTVSYFYRSHSEGCSCQRNELIADTKEAWVRLSTAVLCTWMWFTHIGYSSLVLLAPLASLLQCLFIHIWTHAQTFLLSAGELPPLHTFFTCLPHQLQFR